MPLLPALLLTASILTLFGIGALVITVSGRDPYSRGWDLEAEREAEREYLAGCEWPSPVRTPFGTTPSGLRDAHNGEGQ